MDIYQCLKLISCQVFSPNCQKITWRHQMEVSDAPNAPCDDGHHSECLHPPMMPACYFFLRTKIIIPTKCTPPPHPLLITSPTHPLPTTPPPHPPTPHPNTNHQPHPQDHPPHQNPPHPTTHTTTTTTHPPTNPKNPPTTHHGEKVGP